MIGRNSTVGRRVLAAAAVLALTAAACGGDDDDDDADSADTHRGTGRDAGRDGRRR